MTNNENLSERSPQSIDTELFEQHAELFKLAREHEMKTRYMRNAYRAIISTRTFEYQIDSYVTSASKYESEAHEIAVAARKVQQRIDELEDEHTQRGWSRFFLVPKGHIHHERNCSSCFPTTEFMWLPTLADKSERDMVADHGALACTVCFPSAPTLPEYADAVARAEAADTTCPKSGQFVGDEIIAALDERRPHWRQQRSAYVTCDCGYSGAMTKTYKYRKHDAVNVVESDEPVVEDTVVDEPVVVAEPAAESVESVDHDDDEFEMPAAAAEWLDKLLCTAKREFAAALLEARLTGSDDPQTPDNEWAAKTVRRAEQVLRKLDTKGA